MVLSGVTGLKFFFLYTLGEKHGLESLRGMLPAVVRTRVLGRKRKRTEPRSLSALRYMSQSQLHITQLTAYYAKILLFFSVQFKKATALLQYSSTSKISVQSQQRQQV